jgi:chromosome segregation ATPase
MPRARSEAEIIDLASDAAKDATASQFSDVNDRVDSVEAEIAKLKRDNYDLQSQLSEAERKQDYLESEVESLRAKVGY